MGVAATVGLALKDCSADIAAMSTIPAESTYRTTLNVFSMSIVEFLTDQNIGIDIKPSLKITEIPL